MLGGVGDTVEVYNDIGSHHLEARGQDAPILTVTLPRMLVAPISKGEIVGNIRIEYADGTVEDIPLRARDGVTKRKRTLFQ